MVAAGSAEEEATDERDRARSPFGSAFGICLHHHQDRQLGASPPSPSKDLVTDQSTCSDGSLLSMGSSDLDEDSCGQSSSRHSSKLSLQDKRSASADGGDLEVSVSTAPLSHSAARHKMAVKPKRTHGAPQRRRIQQLSAPSLPATPELNEEPNGSGRSISPELPDLSTRLALQRGPPYALGAGAHGSGFSLGAGNAGPGKTGVTVTRSRSSAAARQQTAREFEQEHGEHGGGARPYRSGSSDQLDRHEQREQVAAKTKKEDLSFFGRLLSRRSGKKRKGERATEQPPAPVLPQSASATNVNPASTAYGSVYAARECRDSRDAVDAAPCSLPTRRLDEKGRYVAAVPPGGLTTHFLTGKQQQQQQRPRQRLEPQTIVTQGDDGDADADQDEPRVPLARTTTPLDGVPIPVKPEPSVAAVAAAAAAAAANRMQVSYSTSPPPPLWPASTETKVVEVIEKTPEARSLFEQEKEVRLRAPSSRIPGLSPFQQRVAQVGQVGYTDEATRDFSSLTEDAGRVPQRRGIAARAEAKEALASAQPPSLPAGIGLESNCSKEREVLRHFDEEMSSLSMTPSLAASDAEAFSGAPDSLEPSTACAPSAAVDKSTSDAAPVEAQTTTASPHPPGSAPRNTAVMAPASTAPSTPAESSQAQDVTQAINAKGKSSSLGSIEGVGQARGPPSPGGSPPAAAQPLKQSLFKANSSDSITHQVTTIPLGSSGLSITQRVADVAPAAPAESEQHCVTVACVPDPGTTLPTASSTASSTTPTPTALPAPSTPTTPTVTLVNLPSPALSPAGSASSPTTNPDSRQDPVATDVPDKDKTEKMDLPAESAQAPEQQQPSAAPRPSALRKSLPPMPVAAASHAEEATLVPEFMRVQLNRVDSKPAVNVVLSTATGGGASPERHSQGSRGSAGVIDPWSVEDVVPETPLSQISLLGLRVKRASSKDDVAQPADAKVAAKAQDATLDVPTSAPAASSVPNTPHKPQPAAAPLQKSASVTVVPQSLIRKQAPPVKRMLSEDNNNVIIVEKKDKKEPQQHLPLKALANQQQEDLTPAIRRKSASRDSLQLQWQSSLEDKEQRDRDSRDSSISPVLDGADGMDGVVLRKKSLPREGRDARDDTPELMKVFARRSLKVRDSEAELTLSNLALAQEINGSGEEKTAEQTTQQRASRDSDKENEGDGGGSPKEERTSSNTGVTSRFHRSVGVGQAPEQAPLPRPSPPSPGDKPVKPAKPVTAFNDAVKDNNNRLRTRKADNVISNGGVTNNNNINIGTAINNGDKTTTISTSPPVSSVVAKMSARWTLPAEAKTAPAQGVTASDPDEGVAETTPSSAVNTSGVPKFKRIQQRKEEWEQRAKALSLQRQSLGQSATQ